MLDKFICSWTFFSQVKEFKVVNIGMRSNHTAILTTFKITVIKLKATKKVVPEIDWKLIGYHKIINVIFKNSPSESIVGGTTYPNYNKQILEAGTNTATINNHNNKGWFHFIRNFILPLIKERALLLSDY